jgi:hypothetical protein
MLVDFQAQFGHKNAIFSQDFISKFIFSTAFISLYSGKNIHFTLFLNQVFFT